MKQCVQNYLKDSKTDFVNEIFSYCRKWMQKLTVLSSSYQNYISSKHQKVYIFAPTVNEMKTIAFFQTFIEQ